MAAFKNKDNGTWYVQFRYTDWRGERQQKLKRGFATKKEAQAWEREFLMEKQAERTVLSRRKSYRISKKESSRKSAQRILSTGRTKFGD